MPDGIQDVPDGAPTASPTAHGMPPTEVIADWRPPSAGAETRTAIVAAGVPSASRLLVRDKADGRARIAEARQAFTKHLAEHGGRLLDVPGEAILAEFPSAPEAVRAALTFQHGPKKNDGAVDPLAIMPLQVGIALEEADGSEADAGAREAVRVASRLERMAEPGGICVAQAVYEAAADQVEAKFTSIGQRTLKGVSQPVNVFRVRPRPPRRTLLAQIAGASLAVLLGVAGLFWALHGREAARPTGNRAEAQVRAALTVSVAAPVQRCFANQIRLAGVILPRNALEIRPDREGLRVTRVLTEAPADVTAGQALAELRSSDDSQTVTLRAPSAGVLTASTATPGALTSSQAPALFEMAVNGEMELTADVAPVLMPRITERQKVTVTPLGGTALTGKVSSVSRSLDPATQLGRIRVLLDPSREVRSGLYARALVDLGERCGLSAPLSSLLRGPEGTALFVANGNVIEARRVETGLLDNDMVEIRTGLKPVELIVQRAAPFLREGDVVRAVVVKQRPS